MIKIDVLKIIRAFNLPICDDCISLNQKFTRFQVNKRCSELERELLIEREKGNCAKCYRIKISSTITENGTEFLSSMGNKGVISELLEESHFGEFKINFKFEWISVYNNDNIAYSFPQLIDRSKKSKYHIPAVYRWVIRNQHGKKTKNIYVGEASELARRIYHYVNPSGNQQTNIRLNELFTELTEKGFFVLVEQLRFKPFEIGGHIISENSLKNKLTRRFIEHMMATFYENDGYNVINS